MLVWFVMSVKRRKRKSVRRKSRNLKDDTQAIRILRKVSDEEAFYFYKAVGKPAHESAYSLSDFLQKIQTVEQESLVFHLERKDFQNWIKKTLGDITLARRIGRIRPSNDPRTKIQATVENRITELRDALLTFSVKELAVASIHQTQTKR